MNIHQPSTLAYAPDSFASLFANPPSGYRGTPFWSWNGSLDRQRLREQIERFDWMGFGGAHVHVRTGLRTPYLSAEYLDLVKDMAARQHERQRLLWRYDEDRWPSGFAGGLVTRDHPEFRRKVLVLTRTPNDTFIPATKPVWHIEARRNGQGSLLARYALRIDGPRLAACRRLADEATPAPGEEEWFAYLETSETGTWFNNAGYVDALNPRAIDRFADVTYDAYVAALHGHLGSTVPAIFTDEPQLSPLEPLENGGAGKDVLLTWTMDFCESYHRRFGVDPLDSLPEVVWDRADGSVSEARWRYHEHRSERFAAAYAGTLGERCRRHGLALTGHLMCEDSLSSQVAWTGESMRSYPHFDIPGIDLLCDEDQLVTAKQAVSVARQQGTTAVLSELYGVTGWHFDFTGHKRQGDWQADLGITIRVPHLSWMTMAGEAKRDFPAAIVWHSPWWQEYYLVEDHFSRLNVALTRGQPLVHLAILHPVESAWQHFGPRDGSGAALMGMDKHLQDLTAALTNGLVDFDFIAESLLPDQLVPRRDTRLGIGKMAYDAVLLPDMTSIRATSLAALADFARRGGRILVMGKSPRFVEGNPDQGSSTWLAKLPALSSQDFSSLLAMLEDLREVRATRADGSPACRLLTQLRTDGDARWFFACDSERRGTGQGLVRLAVRGDWDVERWDTLSGRSSPVEAEWCQGWTEWHWEAHASGHELVRLSPATAAAAKPGGSASPSSGNGAGSADAVPNAHRIAHLTGPCRYRLDEPNVLVLDRAAFRINGQGDWEGPQEVLRLDNVVRSRFGLPPVSGDIAQPWSEPPAAPVGTVELRFLVDCDIAIRDARLALEQLPTSHIRLDGREISGQATGFWVDESISTVALPPLAIGQHEIIITQEVRHDTTREWYYLLGDFGVTLDPERRSARLGALPENLAAGDIVPQGLPFYAGNLDLEFEFSLPTSGGCCLDLGAFNAPLVCASLDGAPPMPIAFPPYAVQLGLLEAGAHRLTLRVYGNRANAFGPLHLVAGPDFKWFGPDCYRTTGSQWSDAWQLKAQGLAAPPLLRQVKG